MRKLTTEFYQRTDVVQIARDLLGKVLITKIDCGRFNKPVTTGGIIIETEAYKGPEDKASHAYGNRRTARTETMFSAGGVTYVYLCYGLHNLFNVVTGAVDQPHAVLIRAIQPVIGVEYILKRRNKLKVDKTLSAGPGTLTTALGISRIHNATILSGNKIWIEDQDVKIKSSEIIATPRIGINYAQEYISKPWRFLMPLHHGII